MDRRQGVIGSLLLLLTAFIWGTAFVAQRSGMDRIGPITFNAARSVFGAAAVGLVALMTRKRAVRPAGVSAGEYRRSTLLGGLCCGLFLTGASLSQQIGLVTTDAGKAGFITAMYILIVPVFETLLFRKRQPGRVWLAVLVGVIGMYLLCVGADFSFTRGDALVSVCALLYSGHILCCDHFARKGWPVAISAIQLAVAALSSGIAAFIFEAPSWQQISDAAVPILYCGLMSSGVAYTLQIVAQKRTPPTVASLMMSLEAVFAALAGALILGERMSGRELTGCAVMFAAILLVQLTPAEKKSPVNG